MTRPQHTLAIPLTELADRIHRSHAALAQAVADMATETRGTREWAMATVRRDEARLELSGALYVLDGWGAPGVGEAFRRALPLLVAA